MKGYMYILLCSDGSYYTETQTCQIIYFEEFQRIDHAYYREKQVQGWSRKKKEALINGDFESLSSLSITYRDLPQKHSKTPKEE